MPQQKKKARETKAPAWLDRLNKGAAAEARIEFIEAVPWGESDQTIERYRLGNGLTVLVLRDEAAPIFSYQTWFAVGSRHERPGKTGLAHLFEHLMFNESEGMAKGEFDRQLELIGAESNAATWVDWTFYYENVPSDRLALVAKLEAGRMNRLVLREPQVTSEKEVVSNERRQTVDDNVDGSISELLYKTAFERHGYGWPDWKGGPMYHADQVGMARVCDRLATLAVSHGDDFRPAPLLQTLAARGGRFTG